MQAAFRQEQLYNLNSESWKAVGHGVSDQAIYTCKNRFGSFQPGDLRRLKQLEQENARLKKLVAERDLEIEVMKEIAAKKW